MSDEPPAPLLHAVKDGRVITLSRDPDPAVREYFAVDQPGFLVLFQKDGRLEVPSEGETRPSEAREPGPGPSAAESTDPDGAGDLRSFT